MTFIKVFITILSLLFLCVDKSYPPSCTTLHYQAASGNQSSQTTKRPQDRVSLPHFDYEDKNHLNRKHVSAMAITENAQPRSD